MLKNERIAWTGTRQSKLMQNYRKNAARASFGGIFSIWHNDFNGLNGLMRFMERTGWK